MKNRTNTIITFTVIAIIFVALSLNFTLKNHIAQNDHSTVGNTAGNLNNSGLFCESDGTVYFSNAYDSGTLYAMNSDESNIRKLSDAAVESLNVAGKYLYYYQMNSTAASSLGFIVKVNGVYRSNLNGENVLCLRKDPAGIISISGNNVYFQHYDKSYGLHLFKIGTNKRNEKEVAASAYNPSCVVNGTIYFNGMDDDHFLYSLDTNTDIISTVWKYDVWNPIVQGDYVYFMDIHNDYQLCRYPLAGGDMEVLSADRLDSFNVCDNYIYYQKSDSSAPALKRIHLDGSDEEVVDDGIFNKINITSNYVYYSGYENDTPVYRTPTEGSVNVTEFQSALTAAMGNL